jgi:hypothetical protein
LGGGGGFSCPLAKYLSVAYICSDNWAAHKPSSVTYEELECIVMYFVTFVFTMYSVTFIVFCLPSYTTVNFDK